MASPSSALRRLGWLGAALLVGLLAWWAVCGGPERAGEEDALVRRADETPTPPPLREEPTLAGAPDAAPPPAAAEEAATHAEDPGAWRITFEVVDPDGKPLPWDQVDYVDARGAVHAHVVGAGRSASGFLDVHGRGHLLVQCDDYVPWVSDSLARPVAGTLRVVARPERGLAIAGEVFQQDGRTPLPAGSVFVTGVACAIPGGASIPYLPQGEVEDGAFRLTGLPPGDVVLEVRGVRTDEGEPVDVSAHAGDEDLRIVLGPWGRITFLPVDASTGNAPATEYLRILEVDEAGEVSGRMTFSTTAPSPGDPPAPIGKLEAAPGSRRRFEVEAQGYEPTGVFEVVVPATGGLVEARVELVPAPRSVARVRLRLSAEGAPLPEHLVVSRRTDGGSTGRAYAVEDGVVTLELGPGRRRLVVGDAWPPSRIPAWAPVPLDLDLAPGEEREIDVALRLGGWVLLEGDAPRPGTVRWRRGGEARDVWPHPYVAEEGKKRGWVLGLLPPGRWTLTLELSGRGTLTGDVDVRVGAMVSVDPATLDVVRERDER